jgi:hypothetical protein
MAIGCVGIDRCIDIIVETPYSCYLQARMSLVENIAGAHWESYTIRRQYRQKFGALRSVLASISTVCLPPQTTRNRHVPT